MKKTGMSKAAVYRRIKDSDFPQPVRIGPRNPREQSVNALRSFFLRTSVAGLSFPLFLCRIENAGRRLRRCARSKGYLMVWMSAGWEQILDGLVKTPRKTH
ncbi:MAG: AlpA family phage regulatory protein, partial [Candidatus Dadabacteria bacterium]|nr:AlpA family phage regulatory protein [Candidatus Dadabacteria bacterium]